jgi:hypothetical protein
MRSQSYAEIQSSNPMTLAQIDRQYSSLVLKFLNDRKDNNRASYHPSNLIATEHFPTIDEGLVFQVEMMTVT